MDDTPFLPAPRTPTTEADGNRSVFRREGEYWTIAFADTTCRLRDSAGLRHVAYLLARPGELIAAVELVARDSGQFAVGSGQEEGESRQWVVGGGQSEPDLSIADSVHRTADCPLPTADSPTHERARVRVTHAIRHTLRRIETHHAELNEHLRATIKTGTSCAYLPDPRRAVRWEL